MNRHNVFLGRVACIARRYRTRGDMANLGHQLNRDGMFTE